MFLSWTADAPAGDPATSETSGIGFPLAQVEKTVTLGRLAADRYAPT